MTSSSLFTAVFGPSSSQLNARVESMRAAEAALMSFAHRFTNTGATTSRLGSIGGGGGDNPPTAGGPQESEKLLETRHRFELFDTEIPRDNIPLKEGIDSCQVRQIKPSSTQLSPNEGAHNARHLVIHGVKVTSNNYDKKQNTTCDNKEYPLVMLHGYMNGALYFYRNLAGLSDHAFGGQVYALDMLGWGLSSRPKFQTKTIQGYENDDTHATEQVFVESLEHWRKAHGIDKMILGGHSMGGYLATAYAEKYPECIDRLILISPAGVPDERDFDVKERIQGSSFSFRLFFGTASCLWSLGVTPASFLRNLPETRGRKMVENYIRGRLPSITCPQEQRYLGEYLYTNAALPGSGEDCLGKILKPTTFAYKPTLHRIPNLKVKHVSFIYGQNDWMDPLSGGVETWKRCQQMRREGKTVPDVHVYGVKNAGHLVMLENWQEFNSAMILAAGRSERLSVDSPIPFQVLEHVSNHLHFFRPSLWQKKKVLEVSEST